MFEQHELPVADATVEYPVSGLVSVEEAGKIMGVSSASVSNFIKAGFLPYEQDGRKYLVEAGNARKARELRELHGRSWSENLPEEWLPVTDETEEATEETAPSGPDVYERFIKLAMKFARSREYPAAYEILLEVVGASLDYDTTDDVPEVIEEEVTHEQAN